MKDAFDAVQTIVLFGGTSEIGQAVLRAVARQPGAAVHLAGPRRPDPLPALPGAALHWHDWDATAVDPGRAAAAVLDPIPADLDLVVMAAGVLGDQQLAAADPDQAARILTTNLVGPAAALTAAAARMREQRHGTLVVLSSVAGLRPRVANVVYGAAKAGLDAFAVGLGDSLAGTGVRVVVVRPGFVHGRMTAGRPAAPFATSPEQVAAAVVAALASGRDVVYVPAVLRWLFLLLRALPRPLFRRLPG